MSHPAFERALEIVRRDLYEYDGLDIDGDKIPFACRMHDTFGSLDGVCHNCLGCNFADATNGIDHSLVKIIAVEGSLELDCADYILWLYLFVERANIVFDAVSLPESYRARNFDCFVTIKRWANFFKHPNYFLMVHHADWFIEGDEGYDPSGYGCVIDTDFVRENYGAEAKSRKGAIKTKLQNKNDVAVLFPDLVSLTEDFCVAAHALFTLAEKNEVYKDMLSEISTFDNYFGSSQTEDQTTSEQDETRQPPLAALSATSPVALTPTPVSTLAPASGGACS
jgi:hypothetical protein